VVRGFVADGKKKQLQLDCRELQLWFCLSCLPFSQHGDEDNKNWELVLSLLLVDHRTLGMELICRCSGSKRDQTFLENSGKFWLIGPVVCEINCRQIDIHT